MKSMNRAASEKASAHVKQEYERIKDNPFRQKYHFEVPAGWCNDPNGFSWYKGKYHLFYQHMPYVSDPGDYVMGWGHAVSEDLVAWENLPVALMPVDEYDSAGCWSGCAVENEGKMVLLYTGRDARKDAKQIQCMAVSEDEVDFEKYENNPVLPGALCDGEDADFRDPCIWKHEDEWYMVIGSSKGNFGRVLLYKSQDLKNWVYINNLAESLGELGTVCECPNFFELDGKYILFISPHGLNHRKSLYLVGDFDYRTGKYFWHNYGEIDWGMDFYAPQVLADDKGRRIMMGWMNSWDWMPWCDGKYYTSEMGWCGGMTLPRELSLGTDNRLVCRPVGELKKLRKEKCVYRHEKIAAGEGKELASAEQLHCELKMEIDLRQTQAGQIVFEIKTDETYYVRLIFDLEKGELIFDREHTLSHLKNIRKCSLYSVMSDKLIVHMFVDSSSIEVFTDEYTTSMTNTFYLPQEMKTMEVKAVGGEMMVEKMELWKL